MQTQKTETPRLGPRIQSWIDAIEPGTPEVTKRNNTGKRPRQQKDDNPRPAKRTTRRALATATGNIMAPPPQPNRPPIESPRRSGRIEAKTPQKPTNRGTQADDEVQEEDTPRANRTPPSDQRLSLRMPPTPFLPMPKAAAWAYPHSDGQPSPSRTSESSNDRTESVDEESVGRSTAKTGSTGRSQSPSKMADLFTAERSSIIAKLNGSSAEKVGGFLTRYSAFRAIGQGERVIPTSIQKLVESHVHKNDKPFARCYSTAGDIPYYQKIWGEVMNIMKKSHECDINGCNEGAWNDVVHGPLLKLVAEHPSYHGAISYENVTYASIGPADLYMKSLNGEYMPTKKVDYVVGLKTENDHELKKRVKRTLSNLPKASQSLNQTQYDAIRQVIVFLSIETKPPSTGGQKSDVQLATWGYSGFVKLHQLLAKNGNGREPLPVMPMLSAHGHHWQLSALHEGDEDNELLGKVTLGTTETIQGIFQIMRALELLVHWGNTEYRDWYLSKVLMAA